ncbi:MULTISPECIES: glycerate kinase [unclassified Curtobacterium]|uniref:glycerate kinase n=1 Tax=unclassified Curtobacterium TaxID=257496 RepID=UPI000DA836BA|nr:MULTISPECIES: glycerate kinase [unclassified Curtobacterium]PZE35774.1 glycerate kinase [Curtobacterium sp. MCPF17_031]PZF12152.1 glycerate kinase [Curtobacterium sp. MCPF17_011]
MRVVIAPDSFKGTATASGISAAIADGWHRGRPDDELVLVPMADGGEGTLDAFAAAVPGSVRVPVTVTGPDDRPVRTAWLRLPDGRAVVELAGTSGLPLLSEPRPDSAHTTGFGQAVAAALDAGVTGLLLGIGGSGSTDGGVGALQALGLGVTAPMGVTGGALLDHVPPVDVTGLRPLPPLGVVVLSDVTSPLLGEDGAAAVFGPQKGVTPERIAVHEARLERWAGCFPDIDPMTPGAGAAGGAGFGLLTWGATIGSGAATVAEVVGLAGAVAGADLVVTGEGRFDGQSGVGKAPGVVLALAAGLGKPVMLVAGEVAAPVDAFAGAASLTVIATQTTGEPGDARRDPLRFAAVAGARLASRS